MEYLVWCMWTSLYRRRVMIDLSIKVTTGFPWLTLECLYKATQEDSTEPCQHHCDFQEAVLYHQLGHWSLTLGPKALDHPGLVPISAMDWDVQGSRKPFQPTELHGSRADTIDHPCGSSSMIRILKAHHCKHWQCILSLCYFSCFLALQF